MILLFFKSPSHKNVVVKIIESYKYPRVSARLSIRKRWIQLRALSMNVMEIEERIIDVFSNEILRREIFLAA